MQHRASFRAALAAALLLSVAGLSAPVRAQSVALYDDFSSTSLDTARWQIINEEGTALASTSTAGGILTVSGAGNRTGAATNARLPEFGAVEVTALGWTGTNQILQLYSGDGGFNHFIEFGLEGKEADGTPILNVWLPNGRSYRGRSPVPGPIGVSNPTTLRIERNGTDYRFLANGALVHATSTSALNNDARVMLYGWNTSVSQWDNLRLSGPDTLLTRPEPGSIASAPVPIVGVASGFTVQWALDIGEGASPTEWQRIAEGEGSVAGTLATWDPADRPNGDYSLRLRATDNAAVTRAAWTTFRVRRPEFAQPRPGQRVPGAFPVRLRTTPNVIAVRYFDNGVLFATATSSPFQARCVLPAGSDGPHTLTAELVMADQSVQHADPTTVIVQMDLYGANARPTENGRAFVFPNGTVGVTVGQNDGYPWPDLYQAYRNRNYTTTENYVKMLRANGVNVMRIMLDYAEKPQDFLENPLGVYNPRVVAFFDWFFAVCERHGMTILLTPWDTFWMNQPWSASPYNAANGGPCATQADFIRKPEARAWQKKRFKYLIDRWGNSPAIFAIDLLNEFDIWWDPATPAERADWVNEMADYVRGYEIEKWGHAHMLTVSSAASNPGGAIGDAVYRHPLFEFANTHQYYGAVNDPKNIIDPALAVNNGTRASLNVIPDGRPYVDSESGPISLAPPWLTNDTPFDEQYYRHMAWAHFASGGNGPGMRWPYRIPHMLSTGMHQTQRAISVVADRLNWNRFDPKNADARLSVNKPRLILMGCADARQAMVWLTQDVRVRPAEITPGVEVTIAGFGPGRYEAVAWNTYTGSLLSRAILASANSRITVSLPALALDMAITARPIEPGDVNSDTVVDMADAHIALGIAAGLVAADAMETLGADLDGDGVVALPDVAHILKLVAGGAPGGGSPSGPPQQISMRVPPPLAERTQ